MLSPSVNDDLQRIVNRIFRLHGALLRYGDRTGARHGATGSQWQGLSVLRRGPPSVASIARMIDLKRQSVQRTADLLAQQGLVTMIPNQANARSPLASLTGAGQRVAASLAREQRALLGLFAGELGPTEVATVLRGLDAMHARLESSEEGAPARPRRQASGRERTQRRRRGRSGSR